MTPGEDRYAPAHPGSPELLTTYRSQLPRPLVWLCNPFNGAIAMLAALFAAALALGVWSRPGVGLPLYARQTGKPCAACHTAFPELTPFGRRFKLGGYTLDGGDSSSLPFAVMLQPSFTHTEAGQPGGAAPHFGRNNNITVQQASLFTGGRITDNLGAFVQATYGSADRRIGWDNTDIRYADSGNVAGHDLLWGLTLNNNPSVQDVWNSTPAWRFPYIVSSLAPQPAAGTFVEGAFAQRVLGLGAYGLVDDTLYLELSGYRTLSKNSQLVLGVDTTNGSPIDGVAPYWRVALERNFDKHSLELGTFGLKSSVVPLRMPSAGTDSFTDLGVDIQYQYIGDGQAVTVRASWINENRGLRASKALGLADNSRDSLSSARASVSYIFDDTWSLTAGRFALRGTVDTTLYGTANGAPSNSGWTGEVAYLPFMQGGPSFWPWLNARIGLQYTAYDKFNGAAINFDGTGRKAHNNNTMFLYAWIMF
jgi:hypothetical protein